MKLPGLGSFSIRPNRAFFAVLGNKSEKIRAVFLGPYFGGWDAGPNGPSALVNKDSITETAWGAVPSREPSRIRVMGWGLVVSALVILCLSSR